MKIKKTLLRNKQAKLEPFDINNKSYAMSSISRQYNNNDNRTSIGNSHRGSISTQDGNRIKT